MVRKATVQLISREVTVKIKKHAWNCFPKCTYAYGVLLGAPNRVLAALPVSDIGNWDDFDYAGYKEKIVPLAATLAARYHLKVVGHYFSFGRGDHEEQESPLCADGIVLLHHMTCCRHMSWFNYIVNGHGTRNCLITPGRRLSNGFNQKRVLREWNRILNRDSYLEAPNV
jgi:hypothetical protein